MKQTFHLQGILLWSVAAFNKKFPKLDPERDLHLSWESHKMPDDTEVEGWRMQDDGERPLPPGVTAMSREYEKAVDLVTEVDNGSDVLDPQQQRDNFKHQCQKRVGGQQAVTLADAVAKMKAVAELEAKQAAATADADPGAAGVDKEKGGPLPDIAMGINNADADDDWDDLGDFETRQSSAAPAQAKAGATSGKKQRTGQSPQTPGQSGQGSSPGGKKLPGTGKLPKTTPPSSTGARAGKAVGSTPTATGVGVRKKLKFVLGGGASSKGGKKSECVAHEIATEYQELLDRIQAADDKSPTSVDIEAIITGWGRRKGCLVAAKRLDDVEVVNDIVIECTMVKRAMFLFENIEDPSNGLSNAQQFEELMLRLESKDAFAHLPNAWMVQRQRAQARVAFCSKDVASVMESMSADKLKDLGMDAETASTEQMQLWSEQLKAVFNFVCFGLPCLVIHL